MKNLLALCGAVLALAFVPTGCSSGGGSGGGSAPNPGTGGARPWAIDDTAFTGAGTDLLVGGDMFVGEADLNAAIALGDQIWATLTSHGTWTATSSLYTYQFYVDTDPVTNWGRAFRYTGFDVVAGPVIGAPGFYGTGTYTSPNGQQYDAVILRTWDDTYWELLIVQGPGTFTHAVQHLNGLPIVQTYFGN